MGDRKRAEKTPQREDVETGGGHGGAAAAAAAAAHVVAPALPTSMYAASSHDPAGESDEAPLISATAPSSSTQPVGPTQPRAHRTGPRPVPKVWHRCFGAFGCCGAGLTRGRAALLFFLVALAGGLYLASDSAVVEYASGVLDKAIHSEDGAAELQHGASLGGSAGQDFQEGDPDPREPTSTQAGSSPGSQPVGNSTADGSRVDFEPAPAPSSSPPSPGPRSGVSPTSTVSSSWSHTPAPSPSPSRRAPSPKASGSPTRTGTRTPTPTPTITAKPAGAAHTKGLLDPAKCAVPQAVQRCLLNTYPVWAPDCTSWSGKPAFMDSWPSGGGKHECTVQRRPKDDLLVALNGTQVTFIGDSTSRRAGSAASITVSGGSWDNFDANAGHSTFHHPVKRRPPGSDAVLSTEIMSFWSPELPPELARMNRQDADHVPPYLAAHRGGVKFSSNPPDLDRLVIVIGASTWDFRKEWAEGPLHLTSRSIQAWPRTVSQLVAAYKALPHFDATRDIIIVRLPIAQSCKTDHYVPHCDNMPGTSTTDFMQAVSEHLIQLMEQQHPDVPLLPMIPWMAEKDLKKGRNKCVPSDKGGTHMTAPEALYGYSEMVMNAIITVDEYRQAAGCDWKAFARGSK